MNLSKMSINKPVNYILDDFIPFKSYKNKVAVNCLYRQRNSQADPKTTNIIIRTEEYMTKYHRFDLNQWPDYSRETYDSYGYDYKFMRVTDKQLSLEKLNHH